MMSPTFSNTCIDEVYHTNFSEPSTTSMHSAGALAKVSYICLPHDQISGIEKRYFKGIKQPEFVVCFLPAGLWDGRRIIDKVWDRMDIPEERARGSKGAGIPVQGWYVTLCDPFRCGRTHERSLLID